MAAAISPNPHIAARCTSIPFYFCPRLISRGFVFRQCRKTHKHLLVAKRRQLSVQSITPTPQYSSDSSPLLHLPQSCPGCGAYTQEVEPEQPGFYSLNRNSVQSFISRHGRHEVDRKQPQSETLLRVLDTLDTAILSQTGLYALKWATKDGSTAPPAPNDDDHELHKSSSISAPVCNRCHGLRHHQIGTPIAHPTIRSLQAIISESPHKYNHIYHVLDAADFPLSLVTSLQKQLSLSPQRSINRRAKTSHYQHGQRAEVSFIITRSDLLAPKKEQVDSLMPYIVQVLRDALGRSGENTRLGNVRCVSSKRGWWTKQIKEEIWGRGGGGWMVGKVNVGKSHLFESVFPKGRNQTPELETPRRVRENSKQVGISGEDTGLDVSAFRDVHVNGLSSEENRSQFIKNSLLPPAPAELAFPVLPLVSPLPGTTASPIRLPFGNGKGELIDLPGLERGGLEKFVKDHDKSQLVMRDRVKPKQHVIKPGQSMIIGGLIRITPVSPDLTVLAYPYVPLQCHVTSTEKAAAIQSQKESSGVPSIVKPGVGGRMDSAGTFALKWNVTKQRVGPLTRKEAGALSPGILPFTVFSLDVLVEGCGWIELVTQVRKKDMELAPQIQGVADGTFYPRVEIVSPDGRHIGVRRSMGAWLLGGQKPKSSTGKKARPRQSMKGVKKELKRIKKAGQGSHESQAA